MKFLVFAFVSILQSNFTVSAGLQHIVTGASNYLVIIAVFVESLHHEDLRIVLRIDLTADDSR